MFNKSLWLMFSQLANMLLPLVTFPLLISSSSLNAFGCFSVAMAFIAYLQVFYEYSFTVIVPRVLEEEPNNIGRVFLSILLFRLICFLFFLFLSTFLLEIVSVWLVVYAFSLCFLMQSIYVKLDFVKGFAIISTAIKTSLVILSILIYYLGHLTIEIYSMLLGVSAVLLSLGSNFVFFRINNVLIAKNIMPGFFNFMFSFLKKGIQSFLSSFITSLYNMSNVFYISYFYGASAVATYSIVEKYIKALIGLGSSFSIILYNSPSKSLADKFKLHLFVIVVAIFSFAIVYNFLEIWKLIGVDLSGFDFRLLFLSVPLALTSYFIQLNIYYVNGRDRLVVYLSLVAALLHSFCAIIFGYLKVYDFSISMIVLSEGFVLMLYFVAWKFQKKGEF